MAYGMEAATEQSIQYIRGLFAEIARGTECLQEDYRFYTEVANNEYVDDMDLRRVAGECATKIKEFLDKIA